MIIIIRLADNRLKLFRARKQSHERKITPNFSHSALTALLLCYDLWQDHKGSSNWIYFLDWCIAIWQSVFFYVQKKMSDINNLSFLGFACGLFDCNGAINITRLYKVCTGLRGFIATLKWLLFEKRVHLHLTAIEMGTWRHKSNSKILFNYHEKSLLEDSFLREKSVGISHGIHFQHRLRLTYDLHMNCMFCHRKE